MTQPSKKWQSACRLMYLRDTYRANYERLATLKGKSSFENLTNLSHLPYAAFPRPIDIEKYLLDEGFFLPKIN